MITVRGGAARLRQDPDRSQAALETTEEIARQTAAEIDGVVGTLRDPGASNGAATAPLGLASLDTLIARHAAAGLDVSLVSQGIPQPHPAGTPHDRGSGQRRVLGSTSIEVNPAA